MLHSRCFSVNTIFIVSTIFTFFISSLTYPQSNDSQKKENGTLSSWGAFTPYKSLGSNPQQGWMWTPENAREIGDLSPTRFLTVDRFADKYPSLTPYHYAANNPVFFIDVNGDSLINVQINDFSGNIRFREGESPIVIDHRFLDSLRDIMQVAVDNGIPIQINQSFRTLGEQLGENIQQNGRTPARSGSRHVAGLAIDFNLFQNNNVNNGVLLDNASQNAANNVFIQGIIDNDARFGGNFNNPDPIHFDAGLNNQLNTNFGINFTAVRDANQTQFNQRGITRTVNLNFTPPVRTIAPAPLRQ